ncbi:unnamed protein product [Nippostrongylus brasiliensis]|uniref:Uncharacterized protein n=1 Tax=Nippostrongylus brasiliensis TaxID=27835 RepID=A0A0N4Y4X3_NIPBR|nr:unnamed protein product [Nippostrongylus brasiliensis]
MVDRPSSSAAAPLSRAISSFKGVHTSIHTLNEDIKEMLEQVDTVENLPKALNLDRVDGWRERLLAKIRMKITQKEEEYQQQVETKLAKILKVMKNDGPSMTRISFSFADDLIMVEEFTSEVYRVASSNILSTSTIRHSIPAIPLNVEAAISRLIFDLKALESL